MEILNQGMLDDIKIKNDQVLIKTVKDNNTNNEEMIVDLKAEKGKIFLKNKLDNKSIKIPIEDKIYIKQINIKDNLINIFANSYISF